MTWRPPRTTPLAVPLAVLLGTLGLAAQAQQYPVGWGPNPALPPPQRTLIPTVNEAKADPWPQGMHPTPAAGLAATAYGTGLDHPRWLYVLPNGDVLVAETNKPEDGPKETGIKAAAQRMIQKKAGAGVKSANRITLLRGIGADGSAASKTVFLQGLNSPFGMALVGNDLYVANADALWRFPYRTGATHIDAAGTKVLDLPAGINHHWTKNVIAAPDGRKLYITVGSNSNVGENGMQAETGRASIWEYDIGSGKSRIYASGLRNPQGMGFQPQTRALWVSVNERDELGDNLVPDYMTAVKDGAFYGWPYSYYGQHLDSRVKPQRPDLVARAIAPDYALGAHTASLGMTFYDAKLLPQYRNGALVSQHGSWNRTPRAGYQLVFVPFTNGTPSGPPQNVLSGFLSQDGRAYGRPVGVAVDKTGAILLADDVGNIVWRITPAGK